MKGLLIKDWKLLKTQRNFILIIVGICVLMLVRGQEIQFISVYLSAVFSMLAVSTIGYDQADNGMNFIFTFPVSREKYVSTKYVFGMLITACLTAVLMAGMAAAGVMHPSAYGLQEYLIGVFGILMPSVVIMSVMIPLQLKFGSEKSRVGLLIILGFAAIVVYAVSKAAEVLHVDLAPAAERILQAGPVETVICLCLTAAGLLVISYMVSITVMKRKQF